MAPHSCPIKPRKLTRTGRIYLPRPGERRQPLVARVHASPRLANDWALVAPGFPYEAMSSLFKRCSVLYSKHLKSGTVVLGEGLFEELTQETGQQMLIVELPTCQPNA